MTPDHQQTIEDTLQLAYARTVEWNTIMAVPQGKNPPKYTHDMLWNSTLGRDLTALAKYIEGYSSSEDIAIPINRINRALFGYTLKQTGFRLPHKFHQTPLGKMMFEAFARYYPATVWMTTAQVQKLLQVKRQTVYDWAEEGKLVAYFVNEKQVYHRQQIEKFQITREKQKQQKV